MEANKDLLDPEPGVKLKPKPIVFGNGAKSDGYRKVGAMSFDMYADR